ncbi:YcxB family protein [Serpentinicella alkaliphila]
MRNIYSNDSYIFIFVNKFVAHIIPTRAFYL